MCHELRARLPCANTSVRTARSCVAAKLAEWGATTSDVAQDRVSDVVLVVSELVGNAARFCAGELELCLETRRDRIEVAVTDDSLEPAVLQQRDPLAPDGRGLFLVDALSERWGQRLHDGNKTVWATLSLPAGSALAEGCTLLDE